MIKKENVPELNEKEFESFAKEGTVMIDFFAEWCMPCMMMSPIIEEMSKKFKGKIKFCKVNVGDSEALAKKFNVISIPNFVLLKNGKMIGQFVGALSEDDLEERLKKLLSKV